MTIAPFRLKPTTGKIRICEPLQKKSGRLMVWFYGGIKKNQRDNTVPLAAVFFRRLDENNQPTGPSFWEDIGLTHLGLLRIGSVWEKGICKADAIMETKKLDVDFTEGRWRYTSPYSCIQDGQPSPIIADDYPLRFTQDRNWLLNFPLGNGRNLLIPCLEFLIRFYGRSEEVPRILTTYSWPEAERHFYAEFDQPVRSGAWPVKLKRRMRNGDVVFLAHAKYDEYAKRAAKEIYGQIEASYKERDDTRYSFIKVAPWFQGAAKIKVSGFWINGGRTFLGLRIMGGSDPQGAIIQRDRENPSKVEGPAEGEGDGEIREGNSERVLKKLPDIIDLTDAEAPDQGSPTVDVEENDFEELGEKRVVIDVRRERATVSTGNSRKPDEPGKFSSGEAHGGGKGVGKASIHARPVLESHGVLHDMWDAMQYLKKAHPDRISSVEWFTFDHGFQASGVPQLIGLKPFNDDEAERISAEVRRWPILNGTRTKNPEPRGLLVTRLVVDGKRIYIVEIQRKPLKKKQEDGSTKDAEESFKGMVFAMDSNSRFNEWLNRLASRIRYVKGVVDRLVRECPGYADTFKHSTTSEERVPCEAAVLNALSKMEIAL